MKRVSKQSDRRSMFTRIPQPPGFQLLATCKQACVEGHAVFYSSNCFSLPSGSVERARNSLRALQPQHREMIETFGLELHLAVTASKGLAHLVYRVARDLEESDAESTAEFVALFDAENDEVDWPPEIRKPVRHTTNLIRDDVESIVNGEGWKALKKKVNRSSM